jgi:hypothetical protein
MRKWTKQGAHSVYECTGITTLLCWRGEVTRSRHLTQEKKCVKTKSRKQETRKYEADKGDTVPNYFLRDPTPKGNGTRRGELQETFHMSYLGF